MKEDPWFDYAERMLQIAIVLLSVSILGSIPALYYAGAVLGLLGAGSAINGFSCLFNGSVELLAARCDKRPAAKDF
jgi:hypothetical protein